MPGMSKCIQCGANIPVGEGFVRTDKDGNKVVVCEKCVGGFTNL